jgi:class 3 adenylate cyclase
MTAGSVPYNPRSADNFGIPVAVAKRLCDAAARDQILASDVVRSLHTSQETFHDRRERTSEVCRSRCAQVHASQLLKDFRVLRPGLSPYGVLGGV